MKRREFIAAFLAGLVFYAAPVPAQQSAPAPVPRVGILTPAESDQTPIFEAFRRGLKDLGYTEGRNIAVEFRSARGNSALLPRLAAELVALPVDIILTDGAAAARAAQQATQPIPIVSEKEAHGEFESECPGYCGAQDTFYVGTMKGVGRIYQQTFIDTYAKIAFAKLYDRKTPLTAADLLNDRVVPFYDQHEVRLCRVLTDRGTEYCGNPEHHEYELYLAVEDVDHSRTKTKSPQTNEIVERFHKTVLNEFYRVAFRKRIYGSIAELQEDLDQWISELQSRITTPIDLCH